MKKISDCSICPGNLVVRSQLRGDLWATAPRPTARRVRTASDLPARPPRSTTRVAPRRCPPLPNWKPTEREASAADREPSLPSAGPGTLGLMK